MCWRPAPASPIRPAERPAREDSLRTSCPDPACSSPAGCRRARSPGHERSRAQKRSNTRGSCSDGIPGPVSCTRRMTRPSLDRMLTVTSASGGVCCNAFPTRLRATCVRRGSSPSTTAGPSVWTVSRRSGCSTRASDTTSAATAARSTGAFSRGRPASVRASRDSSSVRSLMRPSCRSTRAIASASASGSVRPPRKYSSTQPLAVVSGVRSSCEASATNERMRFSASSCTSKARFTVLAMRAIAGSPLLSTGRRRVRSPSAMRSACSAIAVSGRSPRPTTRAAAMMRMIVVATAVTDSAVISRTPLASRSAVRTTSTAEVTGTSVPSALNVSESPDVSIVSARYRPSMSVGESSARARTVATSSSGMPAAARIPVSLLKMTPIASAAMR